MTSTNEVVSAAIHDIVGIVRHLVDHPDEVKVTIRDGKYRIVVELETAPSDVGYVVGRSGYLATSLRAFLSALAGKHRLRIDFEYVTEEDNARARDISRRGGQSVVAS